MTFGLWGVITLYTVTNLYLGVIVSSPAEQDPELFVTAGVRFHDKRNYNVEHTGKFWNQLLNLLEGLAKDSHDYLQIQNCVLKSTEIRQQLKSQGF